MTQSSILATSGMICVAGTASIEQYEIPVSIRVRTVAGWTSNVGSATDSGYVETSVQDADGSWCAKNVTVNADSNSRMTVVAWMKEAGSGGAWSLPATATQITVGGSGAIDCCKQGCCGSGPMQRLLAVAELEVATALLITVPDGQHAGVHRAASVAQLKWEIVVGAASFHLTYCEAGFRLHGEQQSFVAQIEADPFSAVFPGNLLGSKGEVVVTVA